MITWRHLGLSLVLVFTFGAAPALAADTAAATQVAQASASATASLSGKAKTATNFVQGLGDRAVSILADKQMDQYAKNNEFRTMLKKSFDLNTIGRFVIGRTWYAATPEQQKEYLDLFEKLVVQIYSDRFALYSGETFLAQDARQEGERDWIINALIQQPGNPKGIQVDWRVRDFGDRMGVIDVIVEGVSMSITQRQEYMSVIQRNGGDIAPLLQMMHERLDKSAEPKAG